MSEHVTMREVGLRDGLQSVAQFLPTRRKTAWCDAAVAAGLCEIEVTSLVPPKLLPQFADAEEVIRHALSLPSLTASVLIPNVRGAERGIALGVPVLNFVLSASEAHNQSNVRRSTAESLQDFRRVIELRDAQPAKRVRVMAGIATVFGCSISGHVDEARVLRIAAELLEAGADELLVADTVGYGDPAAVSRVFKAILAEAGGVPVLAHFHNTRGLGLANVLAALEAGVRRFDASLGGLGGCPFAPGATGNIVMEDCVYMLNRMGFQTGIDVETLLDIRARLQAQLPEAAFQGEVAKAGLPKDYGGTPDQGGSAKLDRAGSV